MDIEKAHAAATAAVDKAGAEHQRLARIAEDARVAALDAEDELHLAQRRVQEMGAALIDG